MSQNCEEWLLASSCLSVRSHEQLGSQWADFHEIWYLNIFWNLSKKFKFKLQSDKNNGVLYMNSNIQFLSFLNQFALEWEMFQPKAVKEIKTHILCSITFLLENHAVYEIVGKYCTDGQATDDNIIRRIRTACWIMLLTHTHNMQHLLLFHCHNSCTNAPLCYVIPILPVLFSLEVKFLYTSVLLRKLIKRVISQ